MPCFSERLRSLRKNFGLSQQKLADVIGSVSKSSINMYERGEREPGFETMEALADFFNVDLDYLYGKSDLPNKSCDSKLYQSHLVVDLSAEELSVLEAYRAIVDQEKPTYLQILKRAAEHTP